MYIYIWKHPVFKRKLDCIAFYHLFPYIVWFCSFRTRSTCALWFLLVCWFKASFSSSKRPLKRGAHLPQDKPFLILVVVGNIDPRDNYLPVRLYVFFCHDIPGATLYFHPLCIPWNVSRIIPYVWGIFFICSGAWTRHCAGRLRCSSPSWTGHGSAKNIKQPG